MDTDKFTLHSLKGKVLYSGKKFKVFCDGGKPKFRWFPSIHYPSWCGLSIYWLGREFNFKRN